MYIVYTDDANVKINTYKKSIWTIPFVKIKAWSSNGDIIWAPLISV